MSSYSKLAQIQEPVTKKSKQNLEKLLEKAKGLSFESFYDLIGRQPRHGKLLPVLSYEKDLTQTLDNTKQLCILKPVSSGITHYCIMWILWRIMKDNQLQGSQIAIVVGPAITLANRILGRIRRLLEPHGILFDTARNFLLINKAELFSVPSDNLNSLRSLERPSILYCSESDYLPGEDFSNARECFERYISKSDPWIIFESTIRSATGLYAQLWKENPCLYTRKTISWQDVLSEGMYTEEMLNKHKSSKSYAKEILCDVYALGNVTGTFNPEWVEKAFTNNMDIKCTEYSIGIDPGYRPARFGVTLIGKAANGMHQVITSEEYDQELEDSMIDLIISLKEQFNCRNVFVDASDKRLIRRLKGYTTDWQDLDAHLAFLKHNKILSPYNKLKDLMTIVPVSFSQNSSREMTSYLRVCLSQGTIQIPGTCDTLRKVLLNCRDIDDDLIKEDISRGGGADCLDSLRIVLYGMDN